MALLSGMSIAGPTTLPANAPPATTRPSVGQRTTELISLLNGSISSEQRSAAIDELAQIGPAAIPALMKELDDNSNGWNVLWIMQVLQRIGPAAVPAIFKASDGDLSRACKAVRLLGPDASSAIPALVTGLKDPQPPQR